MQFIYPPKIRNSYKNAFHKTFAKRLFQLNFGNVVLVYSAEINFAHSWIQVTL